MSGPRSLEFLHPFQFVVLIDDHQGDGAAQGTAVPEAAENVDLVGLDSLSAPTAVSSLTAAKFGVDSGRVDLDSRREPVHQGHQGLAMGLARSPVT